MKLTRIVLPAALTVMFASSAMALGPTSPASPVTSGNVIKAQYVVKKKVVKRPVVRKKVIVRERGTAPYARTVTLPDEIDNAQSQAHLENGVLTLTLAKRAPTRIQVN